ncbi:MAG TPA: VOC family protein [Stackebrandtia sp.]|jgi:uncharacterized glyoxalase superfamily protein PhnB|uniref:VOC family protein n=1 Tax=Stackebrandtia sp. TaxID=2023065 RepID=UPI002D528AF9|nr:VOC family protein [Stackebrandtia sp.]HZE37354.1 VOC family protein [Stackebrandtia sp.]
MTTAVSHIPEGYTTVTPWVISRDTRALFAFIAEAFGGDSETIMADEGGRVEHAEIRIGDAIVMAFDAPDSWPATPAFLRLYVPDARATFARAIAAGAAPITEPTALFFGEIVSRVRDPLGNLYWIHQRTENLSIEEMRRRAALPEYVAAMEYVQSARFFG